MKLTARGRLVVESIVSALLLILLSPALLLIAIATLVESGWPVLFFQTRVGRGGKPFRLVKIRSMRPAVAGRCITSSGDPRVTRVGKILRKFKLDELPQLWNVLRGEMSLVGPRPEIPEFVDLNLPIWRSVLQVRPGITDPVSIAYRNEERLLATAEDPVRLYRETILPDKLKRNIAYLSERSLSRDLKVILQTLRCAVFPEAKEPEV
jgi:lipopolysaccharide/colanic/teichoic acid biosynthesis glycosyltransferase